MNLMLKIISAVGLIIVAAFLFTSCQQLVQPVDGPGMERDPADYAHEADSEQTPHPAEAQADTTADKVASAPHDADVSSASRKPL